MERKKVLSYRGGGKGDNGLIATVVSIRIFFLLFPFKGTRSNQIWLRSLRITLVTRQALRERKWCTGLQKQQRCECDDLSLSDPPPQKWTTTAPYSLSTNVRSPPLFLSKKGTQKHRRPVPVLNRLLSWCSCWCFAMVVVVVVGGKDDQATAEKIRSLCWLWLTNGLRSDAKLR